MKFSWFLKTAKYPFFVSAVTLKNVSFVAPERKSTNNRPQVSQRESSSAPDRARFETIMQDAAAKAFEHIRLFATKMMIPGISVAVVVNGEQPYVQCYGYSDVENLAPMEPCSKVRLGSLGTTFAALLLTKNTNYDRFLNDAITNHLTLPQSYRNITVQELFSHTSGIPEVSGHVLNKVNRCNLQDNIRNMVQADVAAVNPGIRGPYNFSTLNGLLLSALYESITDAYPGASQNTFETDLKELFRQFAMCDTTLDRLGGRIRHKASHYTGSDNGMSLLRADEIDVKHRYGAYGILSTAGDLAKFGRTIVEATQFQGTYSGYSTQEIKRLFQHFNQGTQVSAKGHEGRPRLGFHHGVGFKILNPLPWNGVDYPEADNLVYIDGWDLGSSSILYMRGCHVIRAPERSRQQVRMIPPRRDFAGTVVSIVCNLEDVMLFELADRVANIYEQAYKLYEDEREERRVGFF